jgi:hypothetical protein
MTDVSQIKMIHKNLLKLDYKKGLYVVTKPITVYKIAYENNHYDPVIITLILPIGALVAAGDEYYSEKKLRASSAIVKSISNRVTLACSQHDRHFKYRKGAIVKPKRDFSTSFATCSSGIHFFLKRSDAVNYQ